MFAVRIRPQLVTLESRVVPIVGSGAVPPGLTPSMSEFETYSGVVRLEVSGLASGNVSGDGTGSLIRLGQDTFPNSILTAAHVVRGATQGFIHFDLTRDGVEVEPLRIPIRRPGIIPSPWYTGEGD